MDPPNTGDGANRAPQKLTRPGEVEVQAWLEKMEAKEQWFSIYKKAMEKRASAVEGETTVIVVEFPTNLHTVNGQWLPCKIENQDEDALAKKAEIPGGIETMRKMCRPERKDFWIAFSSTPDADPAWTRMQVFPGQNFDRFEQEEGKEEMFAVSKETLAALEALKGEGNDLFAHGDFAGAAAKYGEVVDELAPGMAKNGRLCAEVGVHRLYVVALSNRAQCRINAGDAGGACDDCEAASRLDSIETDAFADLRRKVYFRWGQAKEMVKEGKRERKKKG